MSNLFNAAVAQLVTPQMRSGTTSGSSWPFFGFSLSEAGKKVNSNSALTISAFFCALKTIADSYAILPESVMINNNGVRTHVKDHPADYLLYREPNSYMTAYDFKFISAVSMMLKGDAYAHIVRDNSGAVTAYIFWEWDDVTVIENNGKLFYKHKNDYYSASEVLHVRGFSFDGKTGKSILQFAADNLGVSLTAQKFGSDSLQDRGVSQGVLETELSVSAPKKRELSDAWSSALSSGNKHRAAVLDEGFKYKSLVLSPAESKFIETYASGIPDIARWFGIPLHKLHVSGEGGYNFLVQMSIEYIQSAVMPIAEKMKQEKERKTFTPLERKKGLYIYQNYKKLLQADPKARAQFYKDLYFIGAINPDEVRGLEDLNPREDGKGKDFVQPANMLNVDQLDKNTTDENK